ncbi:shugoshin family protein [Niveomyces insectorum RCEF 264]|uniref:Shugoshin family protein n=1 Tax=Niveomyces insectorum RCEF 264 TaxID=1081102 RepID=A0A167Z9L5_9HYPO|nr:shugoshin family protein [Niveomyces insectorum RCEF 264]
MARLNELPAVPDSFDTFRRRLLRQNRDIARDNSIKSFRIRGLENECARLLSENLELRGQILRLEEEVEGNASRRIAEHALQVKQKMEAQLVELGSLLAGFGLEPPTKRQTSPRRKPARLSLGGLSPSRKTSAPHSSRKAEFLAAEKSRLPPISEKEPCQRQTLDRDEILALCSDDAETADSPELGPPPISRLFPEDARKSIGSPSKLTRNDVKEAAGTLKTKVTTTTGSSPSEPAAAAAIGATIVNTEQPQNAEGNAKQKAVTERRPTLDSSSMDARSTGPSAADEASEPTPLVASGPMPTAQASKAGAKRKFAVKDDNAAICGLNAADNGNGSKKVVPATTAKDQKENTLPIREVKNPRSIRDLAGSRKNTKGSSVASKGASGGRKPLAVKSTNEDVSSPRKSTQDGKKGPAKTNENLHTRKDEANAGRIKSRPHICATLDTVNLPPAPAVDVVIDETPDKNTTPPALRESQATNLNPEGTLSMESEPHVSSCPSTPPPQTVPAMVSQRLVAAHSEGRDTPPPADISSQGELLRPSRRARASVSYAEPNLRDKMRRPTKELFDAVAGEGKYVQRQQPHAHTHANAPHQDQEQGDNDAEKQPRPSEMHAAGVSQNEKGATSLATDLHPPRQEQKAASHSGAADGRKPRGSAAGVRETDNKAAAVGNTGSKPKVADPYEFTMSSSPRSRSNDASAPAEEDDDAADQADRDRGESASNRRPTSSGTTNARSRSARQSAGTASREGAASAPDRQTTTKSSAARKRASMVALKRGSLLDDDDEDDPADSSYEPPTVESEAPTSDGRPMSTRDRISRRRSMML